MSTSRTAPAPAKQTPRERLDANSLRVAINQLQDKVATLTLKMLNAGLEDTAYAGQISEWAKAIEAACTAVKTLIDELHEYQRAKS